ncbi:MAG: hypothetical protein GXP54_08710 [Deltaproteobacteria bacterium]|nr:hypothetical protein [Deltaproteobacteria bacterium]
MKRQIAQRKETTRKTVVIWPVVLLAGVIAGCVGSQQSSTIRLPLVADGSTLSPCATDMGYEVSIKRVRMAVAEIQFTQGGEQHTSVIRGLRDLLVPSAFAHPGHYAGGEVTGELVAPLIVDLSPGSLQTLGEGEMVTGEYHGANLLFRKAGDQDGLVPDDPLIGHTVQVEGSASKDGKVIDFEAVLDMPEGGSVIGMVMLLSADADTNTTLALRLLPTSSLDATLFDGVDFEALDAGDGSTVLIRPGQDAHNRIQRAFMKHDYFEIAALDNADSSEETPDQSE